MPRWAAKPAVSTSEVLDLLELPWQEYSGGVPSRKLPDGFSKDSGGRGPTRYKVRRDVYLTRRREYISRQDGDRFGGTVEYGLTLDSGRFTRRGAATVPNEIRERLDAVRETTQWDRQIDGYHEQFREWRLAYEIGSRGGIQDVQIVADTHH